MKKRQFDALTRSVRNRNWAYNHYDDYEMYDDFKFDVKGDVVVVDAAISYQGFYNEVNVEFFEDKVKHKCDCLFNSDYNACGHVLSTILMYEDINQNNEIESYNYADFEKMKHKQEFLEEQELLEKEAALRREDRIEKAKSLTSSFNRQIQTNIQSFVDKELYHLEFDLNLYEKNNYDYVSNIYGDYDFVNHPKKYFELRAKIGSEQMYVIQSFKQLFDLIESEGFHKYGKHLEFNHNPEVFEESTRLILPKLKEVFEDLNGDAAQSRSIIFDEKEIPILFDLFKDLPSKHINYKLTEEDYNVELNVDEDGDYYKLSFNKMDDVTIINHELFSIKATEVIKHTISNERLQLLVNKLIEEDYLLFEEHDLNKVLIHIGSDESYVLNGFEPYEEAFQELSVYIDMENDQLIVKAYVDYRDEQFKLHEIDEDKLDYNSSYVKEILLAYASEVKKQHLSMSLMQEKTFRFLEDGIGLLEDVCTVYADDSLRNIKRPTSLGLTVGVTLENNLLKVDIDSFQFDNDEIYAILKQYRRKRKYFKLKSGEIINLQSDDLEELNQFVEDMDLDLKDLQEETLNVPLYRSLQLEDQLNKFSDVKIELNEQLKTFNDNFKHHDLDSMMIDETYDKILKDYQKHGVKWMKLLSKYGFHGILADDMGLGKTLQVIATLESDQERVKPSLVICPASLLFNWEEELKKFNSDLSHICIHGSKEKRIKDMALIEGKDLVITTYDYLRQDVKEYDDKDFEYIIIDEAQYIKNQKTLTAKAVKSIQGRHRIALTGTPIENSLSELWSIFDFLMPGYLYTYPHFRREFEIPIVKEDDVDQQNVLRSMVEPFILRRVKKDVLKDLPEKIEKVMSIEFDEKEELLYYAKLAQGSKEVQETLDSDKVDNILILKLLGELRQLCCDPRILYDDYKHVSSKMKASLELIDSINENKEKVLLFSSFTSTLDLLELELKKKNIKYLMLTGKNTKEERKKLVDSFQNDDSTVFLISLRAAGVGLNLTAAEHVIHFDPWWNVAAENQASDRAHRIGQKNTVQVYKMIMKNSIEEKILKMQERKQDMADIFVKGATGSFSSLSKDDILDLFNR